MANLAEEFFGALFIQAFIASILYGITTLQAFFYSQTYRNDPVFLKCYVAAVWILETVHTAFCIQFAYAYLVRNFGDLEYFMIINGGIGASGMLLCGAFVAVMVQAFYVRRVYILSNCNMYLTAFITFFMLSIFGFAIFFFVLSWAYPTWIALKMHISSTVTVLSLVSAVMVDVSIVITLMWILIRKRHGIPESTKTAVDWILLYVVNTGALTAASRIVSVVLYTTQNNLAFLGVQEIQGKLYANSFLGSLNTRSFFRHKVEQQHPSLETTDNVDSGQTLQIFQHTEVVTDASNDESTQSRSTRSVKGDCLA